MAGSQVLFEVSDGRGEPVLVTENAWKHVLAGHPEMDEDSIRRAIADPDMVVRPANRRKGRGIDRRINLRLGAHRRYDSLYVVAVIDYGSDSNRLITAYLTGSTPKGELIFVRIPLERS
jgi:hypothetical protein